MKSISATCKQMDTRSKIIAHAIENLSQSTDTSGPSITTATTNVLPPNPGALQERSETKRYRELPKKSQLTTRCNQSYPFDFNTRHDRTTPTGPFQLIVTNLI